MNANQYYGNSNYGGVNDNPYAQGEWKPANLVSDDLESGQGQKFDYEASMRIGFIRKVYGILSVQLIITTLMCFISMSSTSFATFQKTHPGLMWLSLIFNIAIILAICCIPGLSRTVPTNYILLMTFTFFEGYMVSAICGMTDPKLVIMAASMTCAITIALTIYAFTTKTDFTLCGSLLFIMLCCLFLLSIFSLFFKFLHVVVSALGIFLYACYLVYDTQLLLGNKENSIDIEDYIYGALMLYLDIINMFIYILDLLRTFSK